ncbi:MAG: hypothetical protein LBB87_06325, partial [Nitrososphaerota archaeon]|nr:hypothetical protein [Nitrososphaerota archaeon]
SQNVENHDKVRGMFFERAAKSVKNMKKSCRLPKREHSLKFKLYKLAKTKYFIALIVEHFIQFLL